MAYFVSPSDVKFHQIFLHYKLFFPEILEQGETTITESSCTRTNTTNVLHIGIHRLPKSKATDQEQYICQEPIQTCLMCYSNMQILRCSACILEVKLYQNLSDICKITDEFLCLSSHVVAVQLPTRCLVDRFLHRPHGSGYLITCVSDVVTVQ